METAAIQQTTSAGEGAIAVSVGLTGQLSGGLQVGQISNYQVVGESQFYELNLDALGVAGGGDPPRAAELTGLLAEHRLLILAGELEDKAECARRIAYLLHLRLTPQKQRIAIRQRCRGKDPQRIETAFSDEGTTILLLTEISQSLIAGYDPAKLRRLLVDRGGYAIVTTDCDRKQWEIADGTIEARLFQELSWETYYGHERLTGYLQGLFFDSDFPIPEGVLPEQPDGELRVGGVLLAEATAKLKSPERILEFVKSLVNGETHPTPEGVMAKLAELAGDASAIRQWYLQFNDRDQLLVVGLVLLDGLPDDLLFAGLEILVETTWRGTDPLFSQFDYRDLSRFSTYFKQTPVDGGFLRIESGSRKRRADILRVIWNHQRRRLLATLPALTAMIRASATEPPGRTLERKPDGGVAAEPEKTSGALQAERSLSRTKGSSNQMHQVVVESLSLIGLLSVEVVEPYLLDLATDPAESVQVLVAQALAAWRDEEEGKHFFLLLHRWWIQACEVGHGDSEIARTRSLSPDPWAAVRATLAITVGYAAQYDRENDLVPRLFDLLKVLVDDPHPRVRGMVLRHALPRMIAWHLSQLEPFLSERLLGSSEFIEAVARGAAAACEMRPQECLPIVAHWWAAARADPCHARPASAGRREILLATVAMTYGYIRSSQELSGISPEALVENLRSILEEEGHPIVRWHALTAFEFQTQAKLDLADRVLVDLLTRATLADRPQITALAARSYLHQRQQLTGGDQKIELDGRRYAVWTEGTRPLTAIEVSLYGWLMDRSRPVAQQLAIESFSAFAATSLDREERRLIGARPQSAIGGRGASGASSAQPEIHGLNVLGYLAVIAATPGREELRPLLCPLMAEAINETYRQRPDSGTARKRLKDHGGRPEGSNGMEAPSSAQSLDLVFARWSAVPNASAQALAGRLRLGLDYYRWRWGMVLVLVLLLVGIGFLYRWGNRSVQEPLDMLAEQVIPIPEVFENLMAPLPPGRLAEERIRFPYLLKVPLDRQLGPVPSPLGDFASPLPPPSKRLYQPSMRRGGAWQVRGATPRERAAIWKSRILWTY